MLLQDNQECGKSSLTNLILKEEISNIGEISKKNKMGKNTTTEITLYEIEKDTFLLDTPGFQTMDIFEIESKELEKYFLEFQVYLNDCEFVRMHSHKRGKLWNKAGFNGWENPRREISKFCKNI